MLKSRARKESSKENEYYQFGINRNCLDNYLIFITKSYCFKNFFMEL